MLPDELWQTLRLEPDDVAQRARFFAAYSEAEPVAPDVHELIARIERSEQRGAGLETFGNPPGEEEGSEAEPSGEGTRRASWIEAGAQADASREAALAALLLDPSAGLEHLRQAARAYNHANRPYGLFLAGLAPGALESPSQRAAELLAGRSGRGREQDPRTPPLNPSQQVHLMLATASSTEIVREYAALAKGLVQLPAASSASSFGTAGAALAEWWSFAVELLRLGEQLPSERDWLRDRLTQLAAPHGRQLERAQLDSHHWRGLHSSVDLVDLDLAGSLCLVNRRLKADGEPLREEDFAEVAPLCRVSIEVGLEMTDPEPEPEQATAEAG